MADQPFWTRSPAESTSALRCGVAGLTSSDALLRLKKYGRNADAQAREAGLIVSVGRRLLEPMSLVLTAAAIVSAATGDAPSAAIILIILGVSVALDTVQEGTAKRAAEALRQSVALKGDVKRDGAFVSIDAETVVPGDVFRVGVGDIIPADSIVLEANAFSANEAALTGEPYASSNGRARRRVRPRRRPATRCSAEPWACRARRWRWRSAPAQTRCSARRPSP